MTRPIIVQSSATNSSRSKWRWIGVSLAGILVGSWWIYSAHELVIDGKPIGKWFDDYQNWISPTGLQTARCYQVFVELEGDALPFLVKCAQSRQTSFDRAYENIFRRLPAFCAQWLPQPRWDSWHLNRRNSAFQLIGHIGSAQRWKADTGEPSRKLGIEVAIPAVQAGIQVNETRTFAAQAAWLIGPPAASLVPDLMKLAAEPNGSGSLAALQAFGLMGSLASNAVPLLVQIATTEGSNRQVHATQSLGGMGTAAHSAAFAIASLLNATNSALNLVAARALAELGVTPESAVPTLKTMQRGTNEWAARVASLALWNADRNNNELRMKIVSALRSDQRGWMLSCLRALGTNALPFADEVRRLTNDSNEVWRGQALAALQRIQPPKP